MQPSSGTRCLIFRLLPYTSCVRTAKALASLRIPLRGMCRLARAIAGTVAYVIKTKISWAGSNFIQIKNLQGLEIIAMWGPLPISMVLRSEGSPGSLASQLGTDTWTKKKRWENVLFFQAGQCTALSSFRMRTNSILVGKGLDFSKLINKRCD